jgi:hypothetical protein
MLGTRADRYPRVVHICRLGHFMPRRTVAPAGRGKPEAPAGQILERRQWMSYDWDIGSYEDCGGRPGRTTERRTKRHVLIMSVR